MCIRDRAYTISSEFIKKDTGITNDLYLSGAETRSDGLVFYYDYAVDNIPIVISEKTAEETGMSHAVEVVVSNKNVKRYKRITYKYSLNDEYTDEMNIDIISAWDLYLIHIYHVAYAHGETAAENAM